MKYIIPEHKLDKVIFKYLDLKRLEKRKAQLYEGFILRYPQISNPLPFQKQYGILGWRNELNGILYISYKLIAEISSTFGLNESDSESIIGRWFSDRYQLEVKRIEVAFNLLSQSLLIDTE